VADRARTARGIRAILVALAIGLTAATAGAVQPDEVLDDPVLEGRAREVSKGLRCLVCQNQSIDDSDAELARDLRVLVRERLTAGDSNEQVVDYVVSRYGDFVLLAPPFKASTYALWLGPAVLVIAGVIAVVVFYRRRGGASVYAGAPPPLSEAEKRRLAGLLEDDPR
jgi:cytochrome c-type biogenesis protein CcmH